MRSIPRPMAPVSVALPLLLIGCLAVAPALAGPNRGSLEPKAKPKSEDTSPAAATPWETQAPPANDTCAGATLIACGTFDISGTTAEALDHYTFSHDTLSCTGFVTPGRDVVYKFNAVPGDSIWVDLTTPGWDGALYLITDCAHEDTTCYNGEDDAGVGGTEFLREGIVEAGTYYLVVDTFEPNGGGPFTLQGQFRCAGTPPPPSNDRCDFPALIACGPVSFSGTTQYANNNYQFPSTANCTGVISAGRDIVYVMNVVAGDSLSANYQSTANGVAYIVHDCTNLVGTCIRGVNAVGAGGTELIRHQFLFSGTYYLILDSEGSNSFGTWSLTGEYHCPKPPSNDICEGAIPLPCGPFERSGSTVAAVNNYNLVDSLSCTGYRASGRDVVYKVYATAGDSLWLDYAMLGADGSVYVATNCNDVTYSCVAGADNVGFNETEMLRYRFLSTGVYYIFIDNFGTDAGSHYTISGWMDCANTAVGSNPARGLSLGALHPNPFRNQTTIPFALPAAAHVKLVLVDLQGRVVRTLYDRTLAAGSHQTTWDARDDDGHPVHAGVYFLKLSGLDGESVRRAIVVR